MKIRKRIIVILLRLLTAVIILFLAGIGSFTALQLSGKNSLYRKAGNEVPDLPVVLTEEETLEGEEKETWQEGDIRYQGEVYRYNSDILTFLFMGIDSLNEVKRQTSGISGGQSDALFLVVMNPHSNELSVIGINRDTMTDIDVYSSDGSYMGTVTGQITLQHGYGDGAELSCERSAAAVRRLFYNLPIHGYCAVNMGAISLINDAVGGVEVTVLETIKTKNGTLTEGETVLLLDNQAYDYLHYRDVTSFNSAGRRLERQKQYLAAYAAQAIECMKTDITLPVRLYQTLSRYMVTDISVDEVAYLAPQLLEYQFDEERIYSIQGETVMGEDFEEFYPDEEALYELILEVFYEKVQ